MSNDFSKYVISEEHFESAFQFTIQISKERDLHNLNLMKTYNSEDSSFLFADTFYSVLNKLQHYL